MEVIISLQLSIGKFANISEIPAKIFGSSSLMDPDPSITHRMSTPLEMLGCVNESTHIGSLSPVSSDPAIVLNINVLNSFLSHPMT